MSRQPIWLTRLVARLGLALLAVLGATAGTAAAQPAVETASVNGIRQADQRATLISVCNSLANAYGAVTTVLGGLSIGESGQKGEELVSKALGVPKNTATTAGGTRIPDFRKGSKWYEVKNVKRQGWTRQLRDTYQAARKSGKTYTIIMRANTKISSRLKRAVLQRGGLLRIIKCLPV